MFSVLFTKRCTLGLGTVSKSGRSLTSIIQEIRVYPTGLTFHEFLFLQYASVHCSSSCTWFTRAIVVSDIESSHIYSTCGINRLCLYEVVWEHWWIQRKDVHLGYLLPLSWNKTWMCSSFYSLPSILCTDFHRREKGIPSGFKLWWPGHLPSLDDVGNQDLRV